jgi:hypothetical protein
MIIALVTSAIVIGALVGLYVSQLNFYRQDAVMREARSGARAALNVLLSDLRMVEGGGGVIAATATDVTARVPYNFGVVCGSSGGSTVVSLFPADSLTVATAGFSGWATRNPSTGTWSYIDGAATLTASGAATCAAASVTTLAGGRTVTITPGGGGIAPGTPVMLYQEIQYRFDDSSSVPGGIGLFRTIVETADEDELVAPFSETARFRFFTDWETADDDPPADLSEIRGLEVHLDAESEHAVPSSGEVYPFSLVTSIFFMNPTD